ncbi:MAG: hypothetical protein R6V56_08750 [Lentisphaeria bacterium]
MIEYPKELLYSHNHAWVKIEDSEDHLVTIGITDYLREELPEILSMDMPMVHDEFEMDDDCILLHLDIDEEGDDEFYQIRAPIGGHVTEVNQEVQSNPDLLHIAPYEHWLLRIIYDDPQEIELLMDSEKYLVYLA